MTPGGPMAVAILGGTGQQGRGLAQRFAAAGLAVTIGSRDAERARQMIAEWTAPPAGTGVITAAANSGAVEGAEIVVLAVPFGSVAALLDEVRPSWAAGAIVIDVTVPVSFAGGKMAMLEVEEGSASEHIRARLPETVALAAAFKTIPANLLGRIGEPLDGDEFVCGDTDEARACAVSLVRLLPRLRAVDVGPLSRARSIEHLTALAIAINRRHKIHDARFRVLGLSTI